MKRNIKVIAFAIILIVTTNIVYFAMISSSYMRVVLHEVQSDEVNYDLIFFGQSRGETNIDPFKVEEATGLTSYNMSRRNMSLSDIRYLIMECNYKNDMKVAVIDIDHVYWEDQEPQYYTDGFIFPALNNPINKIYYFFENCFKYDYRVSLCRYTLHGFGDIKKIPNNIITKLSEDYKNYSMKAVKENGDYYEYVARGFHRGIKYADEYYTGATWEDGCVSDEAVEEFGKIVKYCRDNNITLIGIHAPVPHERFDENEEKGINDYFGNLFKDAGCSFINFNNIDSNYLTWDKDDFRDGEGHMMGPLAEDYSAVLGEVLNEELTQGNCELYF